MKIFHMVSTYAPIGGVETYVLELLSLLEKHGHQNVLVYRKDHPRTADTRGRAIFHVPESKNAAEDRRKVIDLIHHHQPDVIYLHDVYDPQLIEQVAKVAPTVSYIHIFYPVCPGLGKLLKVGDEVCDRPYGLGCIPSIYLKRCASARHPLSVYRIMRATRQYLSAYRSLPRIIVASRYMKDLLLQNGFEGERVNILPYFVPIPEHAGLTEAPPERERAGILFAGRLEYEKGLPYLLRALCQVKKPHYLVVAGDGSLKEQYVQMVQEMGLSESVFFTDWLSPVQLEETYRSCALTVMPTIMPEPFGKVGVEAMANSRPVVAFNVGGIPDWLVDGHNGYLVRPGDVEGLASKIDQLLADRNLAARLGANGREYVEQRYQSARHLDGLLEIFQSVTL